MAIRWSRSLRLAATLGVVYGVALRILMGTEFDPLLGPYRSLLQGVVSFSFFVVVPAVIGFICVYLSSTERARDLKYAFFAPWTAIVCFLLTTIILLLEGSICVLLALPGFLLLSSLGGLAAAWLLRRRPPRTSVLCSVLVLPLVVSPLESVLPSAAQTQSVTNSVKIGAPPEIVWARITNVERIDRRELSVGLTRLLGVPRPREAHMQLDADGWARHTRWEGGIAFREIITASREPELLSWTFDFPPDAVPAGVLDEHVRIGGRHFELLTGGYTLERTEDGATLLTITTAFRVAARPSLYARYWARWVVWDFHRMILALIRDRSAHWTAP